MSMSSLLGFYEGFLSSVNIRNVEDGKLSLILLGGDDQATSQPCMSNDKRLTLPTKALLKSGQWDGLLAFHPLSENLIRGESEVIKFLKRVVRFQLASVSSQLLTELMDIAATPERHQDLKPTQAEYLRTVPNANEKCVKALTKILNKHFDDLINIYLKRSGTLDGKEYRRVAAVNFPIWDELTSAGPKVYDVDCGSVKNKKTIASLFEYVFPNPDDLPAWSVGSDDNVAPYFHALATCYGNIAKHLNSLIHKYRKHLDYPDELRVNLEWMDAMDNLKQWKTAIPSLPGNEGAVMKGEKEVPESHAPTSNVGHRHPHFTPPVAGVATQTTNEAPEVVDTPPWENPPQVTAPTQVAQAPQAPAEADTGRGVDWRSLRQSQASTPPPGAAVPTQNAYGYPQQPYGAPQPQPAPHASFNPRPTQPQPYNQPQQYGSPYGQPPQPYGQAPAYQQPPAPGGMYGGSL